MSTKSIPIVVSNGTAFLWNGKDWLKLREDYRIVGKLIGCLAHLPRQEKFYGLPLQLLPEEATLLVERKVARLVQFPSLCLSPTEETKQQFRDYREKVQQEQIEYIVEERKHQVTERIEQIVEGKRRKLLGIKPSKKKKNDACVPLDPIIDIDKEALLKEELDKIKPLSENHTLVQTFTSHPWLTEHDEEPVIWNFPATPAEKLRYQTFKDFWEKGYFITPGQKFGVDFLIYPGDPVRYHAQFLVVCMDNTAKVSGTDLVALGRLGTSVRKTVVLTSYSPETDSLQYQSLTWNGFS